MNKQVMTIVVNTICLIAKANVACATAIMGYQPEVPQTLLNEGESNDQL